MACGAPRWRPVEERAPELRGIVRCCRGRRGADIGPGYRGALHEDRPRRPPLGVDPAHPGQERDDVVDLLIGELEVRHEPAIPLLRVELRRVLQEFPEVGRAALCGDLRQIGRIVRALAEERVTVDAVLAVPHVLAGDDRRVDRRRVSQLRKLPVAVDGKTHEDRRTGQRADEEEEPGAPPRHRRSDLVGSRRARRMVKPAAEANAMSPQRAAPTARTSARAAR